MTCPPPGAVPFLHCHTTSPCLYHLAMQPPANSPRPRLLRASTGRRTWFFTDFKDAETGKHELTSEQTQGNTDPSPGHHGGSPGPVTSVGEFRPPLGSAQTLRMP